MILGNSGKRRHDKKQAKLTYILKKVFLVVDQKLVELQFKELKMDLFQKII